MKSFSFLGKLRCSDISHMSRALSQPLGRETVVILTRELYEMQKMKKCSQVELNTNFLSFTTGVVPMTFHNTSWTSVRDST